MDACVELCRLSNEKRVWRYQRGNQNPYIEEEQTTQWPKEKVQKDKQRSTKHTYKTKDRVTWIQLKTGGELRCSGRVISSCSSSESVTKMLCLACRMDTKDECQDIGWTVFNTNKSEPTCKSQHWESNVILFGAY